VPQIAGTAAVAPRELAEEEFLRRGYREVVTRIAIDPPTLVQLADGSPNVHPSHRLVAPTRSVPRPLIYFCSVYAAAPSPSRRPLNFMNGLQG